MTHIANKWLIINSLKNIKLTGHFMCFCTYKLQLFISSTPTSSIITIMQVHMYTYGLTTFIIGPYNEIITNILYHLVMLFRLIRDIFNNYMQHNIPVHTAVIIVFCFMVWYCISDCIMLLLWWLVSDKLQRIWKEP
jgi:hypothetical protein